MRTLILRVASAAVAASLLVAGSAAGGIADVVFTVHGLVGDASGSAPATDATLVNGWGLSAGPTTPWWVSDNGTNSTTLYNGAGAKVPLTVAVPGGPTGTVFNGAATDFVISQNGKTGTRAVPVCDGVRHDPRLVSDRERSNGDSRCRQFGVGRRSTKA